MMRVGPIREDLLSLNSFGICRSAPPSCNSRSFCRYKVASYLHIPQLPEITRLHRFARISCLTPLLSALTQEGRGYPPAVHKSGRTAFSLLSLTG